MNTPSSEKKVSASIGEVGWPVPFDGGVEFNAPARGTWNIVHTGMLLPESHQIFVCAQGCLRGVILTAAEMGAMERMSWVSVSENDLVNDRLERNIVDGCSEIIERLPKRPRAVLVFLSCLHLFSGCEFPVVLERLRKRHPDILFTDCYMHPTMRKSGLTPDQTMRRQLFSFLEPQGTPPDPHAVNLLGNDRPTDESSELYRMLAGYRVNDLTRCHDWNDYLQMARASLNITTLPAANAAAASLQGRLGIPFLYLPTVYDCGKIAEGYRRLAEILPVTPPPAEEGRVREAFSALRKKIGDVPMELDYTATPRLLSLARALLEHGFRVTRLYTDAFLPEEREDFLWLRENAPSLEVNATVHPAMRFAHGGRPDVLAIGQKAAWFAGTRHFVNIVAGGGHFGYDGIMRLAAEIEDAWRTEKETETVIQHKGIGLPCCACP